MGRVYKVFDKEINAKVALKLLKPEVAAYDAAIERFESELRFARKVSHRNVCRMYDLGDEKGTRYITMEYVPGEDLKSMLRIMGPMSPGKTLWIARQVSEGLAEAHRLGVVHRDLKPQNIMIDREGNVRIMDFGIARSAKVKGMTGAGVVVGTPDYRLRRIRISRPPGSRLPRFSGTEEFARRWGIDMTLAARGGVAGIVARPEPLARDIWLLQRKSSKPGKDLGKTTGWVHRLSLSRRGVRMLAGVDYRRIDDRGLHIRHEGEDKLLGVDHVVICAGQLPRRELQAPLEAADLKVHLIGGADVAAELDAKRAIRQGSELAAVL